MAKTKKTQFGELPPKYNFILNPYPDQRLSRCPICEHKTGQRKVPLLIHIDPMHLMALNYTCRYCRHCDLLIGHKHEIERLLASMFARYDPSVVGNDYLIVGTLEKKAWREGAKQPKPIADMLPHVQDFKTYYQELRLSRPGYYSDDQDPPIMDPPPSKDWVKPVHRQKSRRKRR